MPFTDLDLPAADAPIGIFDSGVGALSVLRHVRACLPYEHLLCFSDSGYAPYGGKSDAEIIKRSLAIVSFLRTKHVKAIVVACNTATAAAIDVLRLQHPDLIMVGVEPGLKPAAMFSKSGKAGILATASTLASSRFIALREQITQTTGVQFMSQACVGLVDQIEKGELSSPETTSMLERYITPLLRFGVDTLALGCTHYPFVLPMIEKIILRDGVTPVKIIDTGEAVSRQLEKLLEQRGLERSRSPAGTLEAFTTGSRNSLVNAFDTLLDLYPRVSALEAAAGL